VQTITKRLPNLYSVCTAEVYTILLSFNEISKQQQKILNYGRCA